MELDVHGSPRRRRQVAIMHEEEEEQWLEEGRQKQSSEVNGLVNLVEPVEPVGFSWFWFRFWR